MKAENKNEARVREVISGTVFIAFYHHFASCIRLRLRNSLFGHHAVDIVLGYISIRIYGASYGGDKRED